MHITVDDSSTGPQALPSIAPRLAALEIQYVSRHQRLYVGSDDEREGLTANPTVL